MRAGGINQAPFLPQPLEKPGRDTAAQDIIEDHQDIPVLMIPGKPRCPYTKVDLFCFFTFQNIFSFYLYQGLLFPGGLPMKFAPVLAGRGNYLFRFDVSGHGQTGITGGVEPFFIGQQILPGQAADGLRRPQDGMAQGVAVQDGLGKKVKNLFVRGIFIGFYLFKNDIPFLLQLLRRQQGIEDQIGKEFHAQLEVAVQNLHVKTGILFGCISVEMPADGIDDPGDLPGRAVARPFKGHMLKEMSNPLLPPGFISGTAKHPKTNGHRADMRDLLADDPQAVGKNLAMIHILSHPVCLFSKYWFYHPCPTIFPEIEIIRDR